MNAKVSTDAPTPLAFRACVADVITWGEVIDSSEDGGETVVKQIARKPGADSPKVNHGRPTEDADAGTRKASNPRSGNRRTSLKARDT